MNLRLFCAIAIPDEVETELLAAASALRTKLPDKAVSWVKPGNFHLTLSFLGDVEENRVPDLVARLKEATLQQPFSLQCRGLGCFPNANRPRVLWAGVHSNGNELSLLQQHVASACSPFTQRQEKGRFHGHITLGRVKPNANFPKTALSRELDNGEEPLFGQWLIDGFELISSDLSSGVPRYSKVHLFPLHATNSSKVRTP